MRKKATQLLGFMRTCPMLTDQEILDLIQSPKEIKEKNSVKGYKEENNHKRWTLTLETSEGKTFEVFIRQNNNFIENYSIGLRYQTNNRDLGWITLIRYNGPHGETSQSQDGHYDKPHIHRMTAMEMESGSTQPQEKNRDITDRYHTFEQALEVFFGDIGVRNYLEYFPESRQMSLSLSHDES